METRSRVATISAWLSGCALAALVLGPALIAVGIFTPFVGFRVFGLGILLALLGFALGLVGLYATRARAGRGGRERASVGAGLGFVLVATVALFAGSAVQYPVINDVATDPDDPPVFVAALRIEANRGRDMSYPASNAGVQRQAYADLEPIRVGAPPAEALRRAQQAARELGWEITHSDPDGLRFEAVEVSTVFRFVDDVAVRVRPAAGGAIVDVRSKSRDGRGDLGANAERIRAFRDALKK